MPQIRTLWKRRNAVRRSRSKCTVSVLRVAFISSSLTALDAIGYARVRFALITFGLWFADGCVIKLIHGEVSCAAAVLSRKGLMVDAIRCLVSPTPRNRENESFAGNRAFRRAEVRNLASSLYGRKFEFERLRCANDVIRDPPGFKG
ncbi:hypothetical protein J3R82DRAFT_9598 [Butyriboletus roseoflavus]|nr:hypothetical protein J3R82DRAFT_9598 [Butyriboletus roseoflavus]